MSEPTTIEGAIICSACGGDPTTSLRCAVCGGAGIGIPSDEGFLVWAEHIDDFSIAFRKVRRTIFAMFHLALLVFGVGMSAWFCWDLLHQSDFSGLSSGDFWVSGRQILTWWYVSLLTDAFLIFRFAEYLQESRPLPSWHRRKRVKPLEAKPFHRFDITPYFSGTARDVVEAAYRLAVSLHVNCLTPEMLFAAALASPAGGVFLVRLGLPFDRVKDRLARLLIQPGRAASPVVFTLEAKRVLSAAYVKAREGKRKFVSPIEIFLAAFETSSVVQELFDELGFPPRQVIQVAVWIRLHDQMREDQDRFAHLARYKPKTGMNRSMTARPTPLLDQFSEDLTLLARNGFIPQLVGREEQMDAFVRAMESGRSSVALVGEPGVGKLALVEHLARRMVEEDVPEILFDRRLVAVDIPRVLAGGDPSLASERFLSLLNEVMSSGNIILVLEHIEALAGAGLSGTMDLSEMLASELDRRSFIVIVTSTPRAWTQFLERRSLGTKLLKVDVPEMTVDETLLTLMARSAYIEYDQHVYFSYDALERAATLADRYLHQKGAPEKALDVIREAAVVARKNRGTNTWVTKDDVNLVVQERAHVPVEALTERETDKLIHLEERLHGRVIGQEEAVRAVARAMRRARAEMRAETARPIANFLFLGPTGVGKTELSKALAAEYFGSEQAMIRLDMSEYQEQSQIARLIGAAGDERGGFLTEAVRKQPFAIVLLDELEKAHPDILNVFLQVMDDGRLTDGVGRTVDFRHVVLIATSNAGTTFIQEEVKKGTPLDHIKTVLMEQELKGIYRPEFLNRFDAIIVFKPLDMEEVVQITHLMLGEIAKRLEEKGMIFEVEDAAVKELAQAGFDPMFGARPLRRAIQDRVDDALADLLLTQKLQRHDRIVLKEGGTLDVLRASP